MFYKDQSGNSHEEWYSNSEMAPNASGSQLVGQNFPEGREGEVSATRPEKEARAGELEKVPENLSEKTRILG